MSLSIQHTMVDSQKKKKKKINNNNNNNNINQHTMVKM